MSAYLSQGHFAVIESCAAVVITEKDKPMTVIGFPNEAAGLQFGLWEVPDADNDELFKAPPGLA